MASRRECAVPARSSHRPVIFQLSSPPIHLRSIRRIAERLDGGYNIGVEHLPARNGSNSSRAAKAHAARVAMGRAHGGGGPAPVVGLAIPGQVHRLLKEATSDENLALSEYWRHWRLRWAPAVQRPVPHLCATAAPALQCTWGGCRFCSRVD